MCGLQVILVYMRVTYTTSDNTRYNRCATWTALLQWIYTLLVLACEQALRGPKLHFYFCEERANTLSIEQLSLVNFLSPYTLPNMFFLFSEDEC